MWERLKLKSPARVLLCGFVFILAVLSSFVLLPLELLVPSIYIAFFLSWASFIDIERYKLPNELTFTLIATGLVWSGGFRYDDFIHHIIGAVAGYASLAAVSFIYLKRTGRHGLGLGDAKLFSAAGAWLGWLSLPYVMMIAALSGLLFVLLVSIATWQFRKDIRIAFGPYIALAFWLLWLWTKK